MGVYIAGNLPFLDVQKVEDFIVRFFPSYSEKVIREIINIQKESHVSIVAVGVSYYFAVRFIKNMSYAFEIVSEGILGRRREVFYWIYMPLAMFFTGILISLFFATSILLKALIGKPLSTFVEIIYIPPLSILFSLLYTSFLKERVRVSFIITTSLFCSVLISAVQIIFTWYVANLFKGSVIYGSLTTIIVFLIWINLIFLIVLFGTRLIYRLKNL